MYKGNGAGSIPTPTMKPKVSDNTGMYIIVFIVVIIIIAGGIGIGYWLYNRKPVVPDPDTPVVPDTPNDTDTTKNRIKKGPTTSKNSTSPNLLPMNMMCANGKFITYVNGSSGDYIGQIGIKCSDNLDQGPIGPFIGNDKFNIPKSDTGFSKIDIYDNEYNVNQFQLYDKNRNKVGSVVGKLDPKARMTTYECDANGVIVGLQGSYIDFYKQLGVTCQKL